MPGNRTNRRRAMPRNRAYWRRAMPENREAAVGGGADRLSDLPDGILELVLSFLPAEDAVRASALCRRFRGAWAHAPALNLSDEGLLQGPFLGFAREALARYGAPDIPALHVTISCACNLGPATAAWLRGAMERAVDSVSVTVTAPGPLQGLALPRCLRAKSITLRLSGAIFHHCLLVLPEPGAATSFDGLTELSLSRVRLQEGVRPLGVFLQSCCPQLRKLRLSKVSGGLAKDGGLARWPFVLHLDMLEELEVDRVETLTKLQVASSNLRTLGVLSCFDSSSQWGIDTVVEISAPRLEDVSWSGSLPKQLSFLNGSHCIRRLSGLCFYLPGQEFQSASAVRLLELCRAEHLSVCIDIPDSTWLAMFTREELEHVPHLPNVRALSLQIKTILRLNRCPIAPVILSFLKQCPNLTRLHIDLSMLHQFSRLNADYVMVPDSNETEETWQSTDCGMWKTWRAEQHLGSLREIRLSGFMGTDREMEVADLLFGVWASRPALERIVISLFPQLKQRTWLNFEGMSVSFAQVLQHMDDIGAKMKAEFPLVGGCWETVPRKEITWTRT